MPGARRPTTASVRTPDAAEPEAAGSTEPAWPGSSPLTLGDAAVRFGTASWTDPTFTKSDFYPKKSMSAADRLRHYADRFSLVEVDSSYYRLPSERNSELWAERTPAGFVFEIKAFGLLTGHAVDRAAVPEDLHGEIAPEHREKQRTYLNHLSEAGQAQVWGLFLGALDPLRAAGKLGCLMFQFPTWFPRSRDNREYVAKCVEMAGTDRAAVEFRHRTWMSERNAPRTLEMLSSLGASYVCVDEPQGFSSSVPPMVAATADVALVRFHGRNAETWNKRVASAAERFKYDYPDDELAEWAPRVQELADQAREVHVVFNNCYADYGVRNAATLAAMLG